MAIASPKDIPGLVLWWSAEAQSSRFTDGQAISDRIWDSSGNNFHGLVQLAGITWQATSGQNGGPALAFAGGYASVWRAYQNVLKDATQGEIFATVKNDKAATATDQGSWSFGTDSLKSHYVYNGTMYDNFASTARKSGAPGVDTTTWHRVNIWSAVNDWSCQIDEMTRFSSTANNVAWNSDLRIGNNGGGLSFTGKYGVILLYSRKLTATERADLAAWVTANPSGGDAGSALPPPLPQQSTPQYVTLNVGVTKKSSPVVPQNVHLNVGVKRTLWAGSAQYVYLDVVEPPSSLYLSDGKTWLNVVLDHDLEDGLRKAKTDAELYAGTLVSQQGVPPGGRKWQVLRKASGDNYDAKWDSGAPATTTSGRPAANSVSPGTPMFDTTLGKPIWSNGADWVDSSGTVV